MKSVLKCIILIYYFVKFFYLMKCLLFRWFLFGVSGCVVALLSAWSSFICSGNLTPWCTSKGNTKMTDLRLRWCENDFFSAPRFLTVILMNESVTECGSEQHPAVIWCSCYKILTSFIHQCQLTDFTRLINTSVPRGLHGVCVCETALALWTY